MNRIHRLSLPLALGAALLAAVPALAQVSPKLAPGVFRASDFTPPAEPYVAAVDTPFYKTLNVYGPVAGAVKRGEKLQVLAEASDHDWVLLGKGGLGVGYLPRSLVTPAKYASQLGAG